mmetsp:Transcript_9468/g.28822  ORF Transcript_9468/g.28822 Transcript_9468/m.28822 type:complete len:212 (+) Transcript_9468:113-748(+)
MQALAYPRPPLTPRGIAPPFAARKRSNGLEGPASRVVTTLESWGELHRTFGAQAMKTACECHHLWHLYVRTRLNANAIVEVHPLEPHHHFGMRGAGRIVVPVPVKVDLEVSVVLARVEFLFGRREDGLAIEFAHQRRERTRECGCELVHVGETPDLLERGAHFRIRLRLEQEALEELLATHRRRSRLRLPTRAEAGWEAHVREKIHRLTVR